MADFENCIGCSSGRQGFSSYTYSFSKKLLVATCLAVIIAMCLTPTEAASLEHKNQRQRHQDMRTLTKEMSELPSETRHKRRHQRDHTKLTKDSIGNRRTNAEKEIRIMNDNIIRKLRNTLRDFSQNKTTMNDSVEYRDSNIKLPTTNFMDIRFHNYKVNKTGTSLLQRKFTYIIPKLYKSLKKYQEIFKILVDFEVNSPETDVFFMEYQKKRREFLRDTIRNLHGTIVVILDGLKASHIEVPVVNKTQLHLEYFKMPKTSHQCLTYDGTVIRGYGITLNRWYCLLTSKDTRSRKEQQRCMKREKKLKVKRQHKRQKTRKRVQL